MLKKILFLLILIQSGIFSKFSFSQSYYSLLLDEDFSSKIGAENLLTVHKGLTSATEKLIKLKYFSENNIWRKTGGIFFRVGRALAIDYPLNKYVKSTQHEIFGHGAAVRGFDEYAKLNYIISHPYSYSSSYTFFKKRSRIYTSHEKLSIQYSGSQANTILSNQVRYKCLQKREIDFRDGLLYLYPFHDLTKYILRSKYNLPFYTKIYIGDIFGYLHLFNYYNRSQNGETNKLELDELADGVLINFINPFQFFCVYTFVKSYLWDGNSKGSLPMIKIGKTGYLPSFRYGLTPWGPEYYFENFITYNSKVINFFIRRNQPVVDYNYWGIGVTLLNIVAKPQFSMDFETNIWNQPPLYLWGNKPYKKSNSFGGALFCSINQKIDVLPGMVYITGQLGYKTLGFMEGEILDKGLIVRFGLSFKD